MAYTFQLLDASGAVAFDLALATGTGNPNTLKTEIHRAFNLGVPTGSPTFFEPQSQPGGWRTNTRDELVAAQFTIYCRASTVDDMFAGVNELTEQLKKCSTIKFVRDGSSVVRYIDYVHATVENRGYEGDYDLAVLHKGTDVVVSLMRQPFLRGDLVTVGPTTVNNDPAHATNGKVLSISNTGDAPTPLDVTMTSSTTSSVDDYITVSLLRPVSGFNTATYLSTTHFFQAESFTTAGTDTSTVADATASGGNVRRVTFATATTMTQRLSGGPSTDMDARRGTWDVYLRAKVTVDPAVVRLDWGTGTAAYAESEVTVSSTSYAHYFMGRIYVGPNAPKLALSIYARRDSGSGNLDLDVLEFFPVDQRAVLTRAVDTATLADPVLRLTDTGDAYHAPAANPTWTDPSSVAGSLPLMLNPATNVLHISGQTTLTATTAVTYSFYPRYYT